MQSLPRLMRQRCVLVAVLGLSFLAGCSQDDGIRQYTAESIEPKIRDEIPVSSTEVPQPAWFFKITGPSDAVLKQIVPFSQIVKSLRFEANGTPRYDLPEGWTASNGPPPRYQTLKIGEVNPPLEVTVSSLPGPRSGFDEYLLSNINRWRGQLGLVPYAGDDWLDTSRSSGELVVIPVDTRVIAMVNLVGKLPEQEAGTNGASRMLGAVVLFPPTASAQQSGTMPSATPPVSKSPLDFTVPEGWATSAGNAMRLASFETKHESGAADVSVTRIPGGGDVLSNVNRWRGQVKLDPLSAEELKSSSKEMKIAGKEATYVEAVGPEQTILAAIVQEGDVKWFFKMQGPKEAVAAETKHFEEFLQSVKIEK